MSIVPKLASMFNKTVDGYTPPTVDDVDAIIPKNGKPTLILVRGLPGSGKSTLAKKLVEAGVASVHCEADQSFVDNDGNYSFVPSLLPEAHKSCQLKTETGLTGNKNVVVSNTTVKFWEFDNYQAIASKANANIVLVNMRGNYGNIHGVPEDKLLRMKEDWVEIRKPSIPQIG